MYLFQSRLIQIVGDIDLITKGLRLYRVNMMAMEFFVGDIDLITKGLRLIKLAPPLSRVDVGDIDLITKGLRLQERRDGSTMIFLCWRH